MNLRTDTFRRPFSAAIKVDGETERVGQTILPGLLVFVGYYLGARLGLALTFQPHPVSVMWPPNSILLAALLLNPSRRWWLLLLAAFAAHLLAELPGGVPLRMVLCWFISNCSEALIGAGATRCVLGSAMRLDRMKTIGIFFLCGVVLAPFLSSFLDSAFVSLNHFGDQSYWHVWWMRFSSNVFAALTLAPPIIMWGTRQFPPAREFLYWRVAEGVLAFGGLLTVSMIVFGGQAAGPGTVPALLYAPLPFLLWAAVRFGATETSTAMLGVALLAIWGAVHGRGPFVSLSPEENALSIQVFFAVISTTLLFLATSVTERGRAEERFTKAFRSSPDAMLISRMADGRVIEVNDRWEKMLGYGREETVGRNIFELNICTSEANHERFVAALAKQQHFQDLELCLRARSGDLFHTSVSADTDEIGSEQCWIFSVRDFSDHKRAEEAQINLAHASRLAVVGELTAMIAHEVNQPLGAILSNADAAEMLIDSSDPPLDEIRKIISDIRQNDLRADEAIRRIRGLLRKREVQLQALDVNETITDVLHLVTGDAMRRRVRTRKELARHLPQAFGDPVHLQQVLLNLFVNGMDAMDTTAEPERELTVRTKLHGQNAIEVTVADRGHGIAPEQMNRIFDSFFTTKKEGMGLGLSIAHSIISAHHGRIWAQNNPKGGSTFHFTIPIASKVTGCAPANNAPS